MSITSRQNPIPFTLTPSTTNYVLGSYSVAAEDGLPLNRGADWRVTFDLSGSGTDLTFEVEVQVVFGGPWAFLESFVVAAGSVATFQRSARGYALRASTDPGVASPSVTVSFEGWSAD